MLMPTPEICREIPPLHRADLRHDLGVVGDRPRDQLRKKCDEERIVEQCEVAHEAAMGIDQKRDLLEGDE